MHWLISLLSLLQVLFIYLSSLLKLWKSWYISLLFLTLTFSCSQVQIFVKVRKSKSCALKFKFVIHLLNATTIYLCTVSSPSLLSNQAKFPLLIACSLFRHLPFYGCFYCFFCFYSFYPNLKLSQCRHCSPLTLDLCPPLPCLLFCLQLFTFYSIFYSIV